MSIYKRGHNDDKYMIEIERKHILKIFIFDICSMVIIKIRLHELCKLHVFNLESVIKIAAEIKE